MTTYVLPFDCARIRARVVDGEALWFLRDVVAAAGVRLPPGPLPSPSPHGLVGLGTTGQVETLLHGVHCPVTDAFMSWAIQAAEQLIAPTGFLQFAARRARTRGVTPAGVSSARPRTGRALPHLHPGRPDDSDSAISLPTNRTTHPPFP